MSPFQKANIFLTLCTILWGATFVVLKVSLLQISPLLLVAVRFGMAALFLTPFILIRNPAKAFSALTEKGILKHSFYLSLMMTAGFGFQTAGLQYTTASRSAFITELLILFTPVFQYFTVRKLPGIGNYLGMILILPGMYLLTSFGDNELNIGDALTFFCALGFAMYITYLDYFSRLYDEINFLYWQLIFTAIIAGILAFFTEEPVFEIELNSLLSLLYLSLAGTLVAVYWQIRYQKHTTPVQAGILYSLEPVFATIFAVIFLSESPDLYFFSGAGLILAGVILSHTYDGRKKWLRHFH
ncbi:MAG: DMT family transporter [Spirochaetia bacterium]|nr:DMT family transporter [Spirochaetia bacterium]